MYPPLKKEPIIFAHGLRVYGVFCAVCGKAEADETETLHELKCSDCGQNVFRFIRDVNLGKLMIEKEGKFNV